MPIKTSSAKAKSRLLQQWVCDQILKLFPTLESDDVQSTSSGANGEDVKLSPAARKLFPFSVECKSVKAATAYGWYEQSISNAKGYEPIVVFKINRKEPLVIVKASYFFDLIRSE